MAKFTIGKGISNYIAKLEGLEIQSEEMIMRCVYEGAKITTDRIKSNIEALPISTKYVPDGQKKDGITPAQKSGLIEGLGIAHHRDDGGFINVKVGEDGYNGVKGKGGRYQANAMIARAVESGTSFRQKHPFIAPAVNATKAQAEAAMAREYDRQVSERFG